MADSFLLRCVDELLAQVKSQPVDPTQLERNLLDLRKQAEKAAEALVAAQRENQTLTLFYTLQGRLFDELTPGKVAEVIGEIAINFLGTEDFALFIREGETFAPRTGMGPTFEAARPFSLGQGPRGTLARGGETGWGMQGTLVQACLVSPAGQTVGFLEVGTLLRHKPRLTFEDRELLSLIRQRGGAALAIALERGEKGTSPGAL